MDIDGSNGGLAVIATCDLAAITRGRAFRADRLSAREAAGVGWVPADLALTTFGGIAEPNPFGALGDLRLLPTAARAMLPAHGGRPDTQLILADIVEPDGTPWACCPRRALVDAVRDLEARHGLRLRVAFEQELTLEGIEPGPPFSVEALRAAEPFGTHLVEALDANGLEPEDWLPEYGSGQYEITVAPSDPVTAADRAILVRALARDVAASHGVRAVFAPIPRPGGPANGVHVHFSLYDAAGEPVTLSPASAGLSEPCGRFAAGLLAHAGAVVAWAAPSVVSPLRLGPGHWSAAAAFLGRQNREALVRLCPFVTVGGRRLEDSANLEFRACDATANPWLALAAIIRAGIDGLDRALPAAPLVDGELDAIDAHERARLGIAELPRDLAAAQAALEADPIAVAWFAPNFTATHLSVRRSEAAALSTATIEEACRSYAGVI